MVRFRLLGMGTMRYKREFALEIIKKIDEGKTTVRQAAENYNIPKVTIYQWLCRYRADGNIRTKSGLDPKISKEEFELYMRTGNHNQTTMRQIAGVLDISFFTAISYLKRSGFRKIQGVWVQKK